MDTRKKLIRIAYENPEYRAHLLPIIQESSKTARVEGPLHDAILDEWNKIHDIEYAIESAQKEYNYAASYRGAKGERDAKKILDGIKATLKTLEGVSKAFDKILKMERDFISKHGLPEDYVNETSYAFGFRSSADIDVGSPKHINALKNGIKDVKRQIKVQEKTISELSDIASPLGDKVVEVYVRKDKAHLENRKRLLKALEDELKDALKKSKSRA